MSKPTPPRERARPRSLNGSASTVRWSKVRTARKRVVSGYYDRPVVREAVVQALWREFQSD